jgi:hypothetical protein
MEAKMSGSRSSVFWLVCRDEEPGIHHATGYDLGKDMEEFDYFSLLSGKKFDASWPGVLKILVKSAPDTLADYLGNALGLPIVSEKLLTALKPYLGSTQVLPAPLFQKVGRKPVQGFSILNVLNVFDCVNLEKSVVSRDDDEVFVSQPCFDPRKISDGAQLFRFRHPDGFIDTGLYVTDELAQSLRGKGITGICFAGVDVLE